MAQRNVHYEAAFEDYLRAKGWPYVAVDEAKRAIIGNAGVKSFDFVVYSQSGPNLLIDVKGRKFPDCVTGKRRKSLRAWENWITQDDVDGLDQWQGVFGEGFVSTLVFAYWLQGPPQRSPFEDVHLFRQKYYAFVAVGIDDYVAAAKPRSPKWRTISIPSKQFKKMAGDVNWLLQDAHDAPTPHRNTEYLVHQSACQDWNS